MNRHAAEQNAVFWRKNARRYDRATLVLNRRFSEMTALVAEDLRGADRVLEVAAGTGLVTARLAAAVTSLIATDRSPQMLEVLSGRLKHERVANVDVRIADAASLEFPDHTFDAVVAANLLHLVDAPARVLAELRRVLRPGGILCVPTFGHGQTILAHVISRLLGLVGFPVVTRFRAASLRGLVEGQGFTIIRSAVVPGALPLLYLSARPKP